MEYLALKSLRDILLLTDAYKKIFEKGQFSHKRSS